MRWLLLLLMLLLPSGLAGPVAAADCGTPFYAGDWERDGAKLREFNRLQITFTCRSVPLTGGGEMTEIDYHARLAWLQERRTPDLVAWLEGDPEAHDARAAGWWLSTEEDQ